MLSQGFIFPLLISCHLRPIHLDLAPSSETVRLSEGTPNCPSATLTLTRSDFIINPPRPPRGMFSHLSIQFIFVPLKFQVDIEIKEQQLRCPEHLPCIKYSEFQRLRSTSRRPRTRGNAVARLQECLLCSRP